MSEKVLVMLSPYENVLLLVNTVCCLALVYFLLYVPYQAANATQGFVSATEAGFHAVSSDALLGYREGLGSYEYPVFWNGGSYAAVNADQQASSQMAETNVNLPTTRGGFTNNAHLTKAMANPY
jgi:hypothetical protein